MEYMYKYWPVDFLEGDYPEEFSRRGIYEKRIAASPMAPRNDRESMRPLARGPPGGADADLDGRDKNKTK